jgi:hypothetical protein
MRHTHPTLQFEEYQCCSVMVPTPRLYSISYMDPMSKHHAIIVYRGYRSRNQMRSLSRSVRKGASGTNYT